MSRSVAILISGGGTNMAALIDSMAGAHPARPCLVLSSTPDAKGLEKARDRGVARAVVDRRSHESRASFEAALTRQLAAAEAELICLAGFMRILSPDFVAAWSGRILNIHPSLLPKYPGLNTHARALAAGDRTAGCTVHEVTAMLDAGPILGQAEVPVLDGDTPESLAARVLSAEHRLYPAVLDRVARGQRGCLRMR